MAFTATPIELRWEQLISFENLYKAYKKARKGKQHREEVSQFSLALETELWHLHQELSSGVYQPGTYRQFTIYERKPRLISAAPFRDRVVHHALMNCIEALIDDQSVETSFACRKGKGVHAAVDYYQHSARRFAYALKLDIKQYFPSIDHQILRNLVARYISDDNTISLTNRIIDNSPPQIEAGFVFTRDDDLLSPLERKRGIPIGNLTSQFFANLYLNDFDHWVKNELKAPAYLRYVDDLFVLADNKSDLWRWRELISEFLRENLRLALHERKVRLIRTSEKLDVLGYQVSRTKRWLRNENGYRARRKLKRQAELFSQHRLEWSDLHASARAWIGHAKHGETKALRESMFSAITFNRAGV